MVFFSSRRRHTRYWRDWSSDVCSSDLTDKPMTVTFKRVPDNRVLKMAEKIVLKPYERRPIQVSYTFPRSYDYDRRITLRVYVDGHEVKSLPVKWFGSKNILHMR